MTLTHRLTIATALSATLATALIAGPAMASPSDENQPTGPGTANGDEVHRLPRRLDRRGDPRTRTSLAQPPRAG